MPCLLVGQLIIAFYVKEFALCALHCVSLKPTLCYAIQDCSNCLAQDIVALWPPLIHAA